jgi:hypothetical protein
LYQFENYCPHKNDYLGVRELLKLEQNKIINLNNEKFNKLYQENLEVMVPISPESYLWYEYGPSRGILSSAESEEIKTVYEMQNNSNNKFFFAFSEPIVNQAIVKAKLRYVNTNINITLGEDNVKLTTPTVPDIYKENINYSLNGTKGGNYILQAQKNLKYKISLTGIETFSIILDQNIDYSLYSVKLEKHKIIIDNTEFEINEDHPPKNIIFHYTHPSGEMENAIYDFKSHKLLIDNIHFDFDGSHVPSTLNELKDKIDSLSGIYQNEGFVEINHFPLTNMPSFDHSVKPMPSVYLYYKGWYDLKKKEFISYLNQYNSDYSITALEFFKFKLLGKFENKTYYYNFVDHVVYFEDTDGFLKPLLGSDLKIENPIFGDTEGSLLFKDSKKNNVYNINLKNKKIGSASINLNLTNKNRNTDRKFKEFSENISEYDVNLIDKNFNVFISPENIVLSLFIKDKKINSLPHNLQIKKYIDIVFPEFKETKFNFIVSKLISLKEKLPETIEMNKSNMDTIMKSFTKEHQNVSFGDINELKRADTSYWRLSDEYDLEMNTRMNWAAASDIARLEILNQYGGIYLDVDLLPNFKTSIYSYPELAPIFELPGYKNSHMRKKIEIAFSELMMNQNKALRSITQRRVFSKKFFDILKDEIQKRSIDIIDESNYHLFERVPNALNDVADILKNEDISALFSKIGDVTLRKGEFSVQFNHNAVLISNPSINHPSENSDWLDGVIIRLKQNYNAVKRVQKKYTGKLIDFKSDNMTVSDFISELKKEQHEKGLNYERYYYYRYDTLVPDAQTTIFISGPDAIRAFLNTRYLESKFLNARSLPKFNEIYSAATEAEADSSWLQRSENLKSKKEVNWLLKVPITGC